MNRKARRACGRKTNVADRRIARQLHALFPPDAPDPGPVESPPTHREVLRRLLGDEALLDVFDRLAKPRAPGSPGRNEAYPTAVAGIFAVFVHKMDSKTAAERFMRENWPMTRRALRDRYPEYHCFRTNKGWMRRQRYDDYKKRHELYGERLDQEFEAWAADKARQAGIGRRTTKSTITRPERYNMITGDGTVLRSPFKYVKGDKATRRDGTSYVPRVDPDAATHETGSGTQRGTKFVVLTAQSGVPNGMYILGIRQQKSGDGGEMAVGVPMVEDTKRRLPELQAIAWDMAARGQHIAEFLRLGLLPVIKVHGKKKKRPKYITTHEQTFESVKHKLKLYALPDGSLALKTVNEGKETLVPLLTRQARPRPTNKGVTWFVEVAIPAEPEVPEALQGKSFLFRFNDLSDPTRSSFLAEHLRIHGENTDAFQNTYWNRNTSETANGWAKEDLHQGRARSVSHDMQHLDMIGAGIYRNLQSLVMHERRRASHSPPPVDLAA